MSQMTEASKKRMEEAMVKSIPARYSFYKKMQSLSIDTIELRKRFKEGYQAGMQDPDANKELLDECEKMLWTYQNMGGVDRRNKLQALLNKIREARK